MPSPSEEDRLDALFAAARRATPRLGRLEYGFETRLLARLREERETSVFACAWRLCPFFAAIALALAAWNYSTAAQLPQGLPLLAQASAPADEQALSFGLTGEPQP